MLVADVQLSWVRSVSSVNSRKIEVTVDGETTTADLGPEVSSFNIAVKAGGVVSFKTTVTNPDGLATSSESFSFTLDDLKAPQPDTGLGSTILGVRDVPDTATA